MKLFKKLKKGFTLVELVVVIAVIAILAAISVVSYIGVTNKARAAADSEIITQLNIQMRSKSSMEGPNKTAYEAYLDAKEIGFNLELMKPSSKGEFVWDQENDLFACVEVNEENKTLGKVIAEDKTTKFKNSAEKNWVFTSKIDSEAEYCQYLNSKDKNENVINAPATIKVKSGFDAGENMTVKAIEYQSNAGHSVVIRTNSFETNLTINAPKDVISHFDVAGSVNIIKSHTQSYHEYGKVPFVEIAKGRIALEKGAEVEKLHFNARTEEEFDNIIVAADPSVTLPEFSRDEVVIGDDGTLVVELQKDTKNDANTESDYVYLYKQGVISQIVVTEEKVDGIHKNEESGKFYGYTKDSTTEAKTDVEEVKLGVAEKTQETQKAAVEIANNYTGSHGTTQTVGGKEDVNVAELDENGDIKTEEGKSLEETIGEVIKEGGKDSAEVKKAATMFAGGDGTQTNPYKIATADHWNNFYQMVYDWLNVLEGDHIPYFELTNDIDLTNIHIKNYAIRPDGSISYGFYMWFDLDGNDHTVKGITYLDGYCQVFPYTDLARIHDITFDYNLDETRTAALVYYPAEDLYITNVTTTGSLSTTADWATPFVAYAYDAGYGCNIYYTNCVNYANIKGGYGNNGYTAVFGSHNGGGGHITFDNCKNYGGLLGGHVGFVGMGNDSAYTFVDSNAVKNYGTMAGTKSVGYFNNSGDATSKTIGGVTCEVKQSSASKSMSTTHTNTAPANFGDVITINEVEGATKYEVQMSISIGVYNYSTVGPHWGGGFPRSMTFVYTENDVKDGKIATDLIKGYFGEIKADQYYGYGDTMPTYSGMFLPDGFDLKSNDVTILENQGDLYLVEYEGNYFYVLYSEDYHGWYALLGTNDAGEITTKNLTVSFSVTAYNPNGSVLSFSSFSYTASVADAISYFSGLGE